MRKKILGLTLSMLCLSAMAINNSAIIIKADRAYTSGNLTQLGRIYSFNSREPVVKYLYAKALLNKNIAGLAYDFVWHHQDNYLREDLLHQLLLFYFDNQEYANYLTTFEQLHVADTSLNEKCGSDYAKLMINSSSSQIITNRNWLISNNVPLWCAKLIALQYKRGIVDEQQRNKLLDNLIISGKTDIFNAVAYDLAIRPINFYHYQNDSVANLPENEDYPYLVVSRMAQIAHPYPEIAKHELADAALDSNTKTFLENYLALQFALKQQFAVALQLFNKYNDANLSDPEQAWKARSYMYYGKWQNVVDSIDAMTPSLMQQDIWQYWLSVAYMHLGNIDKARTTLEQIPHDYSYYSMLRDAVVGHNTQFNLLPPVYADRHSSTNLTEAKSVLALYQMAMNSNSAHLSSLATNCWYYLVKRADDRDKLAMSIMASRIHAYHLSIFAADGLSTWYLNLSFPTPFLSSYSRFSSMFGLNKTYPLAISRQESRFNYSVIAFDGGVGLMQIMPQTAAYIAKKSGMHNCYHVSAECNIKFGAWYLSNLLMKFNANRIYATAAYNAGPHRVRMWQDNLSGLDDLIQIELIPIDITRSYVQKVLTNQAAYTSEFNRNNNVNLSSYIKGISSAHYLTTPDDDNTDATKLND